MVSIPPWGGEKGGGDGERIDYSKTIRLFRLARCGMGND